MLVVVLVGAAASALLMALLYRPEVDPSRVYYGTDTRAAGLLVGAALAFVWAPGRRARGRAKEEAGCSRRTRRAGRLRRRWGWTTPLLLDVVGLAALGGLVWACLNLGEFQPSLYWGGFGIVALVSAILVAAAVHPRGRLGAVLSWGPLRWIGLRSYGIYLWHWPVFMVSRPNLDVPIDGLPLLLARLAVTVVLAALSYRYVETPIRRGALGRTFGALREARGTRRWRLGARVAGTAVPVLACCVALGLAVADAKPPKPPSYLSKMAVRTENPVPAPKPADTPAEDAPANAEAPSTKPKPGAANEEKISQVAGGQEAQGKEGEGTAANAGDASDAAVDEPSVGGEPIGVVTTVGDSVMPGAVDTLQQGMPNLALIDARGNRQATEAIAVLKGLRATGKLGDVVVVHIGNNGVFTDEEFDEMMRVLSGTRKVLVVNTTVPETYSWAPNNEVLAAGVQRYPEKAVLVDWHAASAGHPEYFWDGLHLTPQGAKVYADLIATVYREQ